MMGPIEHRFLGKSQYLVMLLDDYSGYAMVRFITGKNEAAERVIKIITGLENVFNDRPKHLTLINENSVKWIHFDGSGKYVSHQFQK